MADTKTETNTEGGGIKMGDFASKGDWINKLLIKHCSMTIGAVAEVKDKDGKITTRAKKGREGPDVPAMEALARENGITPKTYVNPGMARMNIGNMLRAAAKRRFGLNVNGSFKRAPEDFETNETKTEKPDGSKIAAKPKATEAKDKAAA